MRRRRNQKKKKMKIKSKQKNDHKTERMKTNIQKKENCLKSGYRSMPFVIDIDVALSFIVNVLILLIFLLSVYIFFNNIFNKCNS